MSFSWGEVARWRASTLDAAATSLTSSRDALVDCNDELVTMGTPAHWTGDAAQTARTRRETLNESLEDLVAQVAGARRVLMEGADAVTTLERHVEDAEGFARTHGLAIGSDGSVTDVDGPESEGIGPSAAIEATAERERLVNECAEMVESVIREAEGIDRNLCVVLDGIVADRLGSDDAATLAAASQQGYADARGDLDPPASENTPAENAAWWEGLTELQQQWVLAEHPSVVGNLDGIPFAVRDEANRALIDDHRETLEEQLEQARQELEDAENSTAPGAFLGISDAQDAVDAVQARLDALDQVEEMASLPDHHVLGLDFSDDRAQAIIAQGDLDTASHAAVFTPGLTSTVAGMGGYDEDMGLIRARSAEEIVAGMSPAEIEAAGGLNAAREAALADVASVTWLDYQAPQWDTVLSENSVATSGPAEEGGADLADFFRGIEATRADEVDVTAMGHSYGSTTTGYALQEEGTGVDRAVFFGSPGLGTDDVSDLHVPEGSVYYSEASGDAVGDLGVFGGDPTNLDGVTQLQTGAATAADGSPLAASSGHSEYLVDGSTSAYNLAQLVVNPDGVVEGSNIGFFDWLGMDL